MIAQEVVITRQRSGWAAHRTLHALGIRPGTYYRHVRAAADPPAPRRVALDAVLPHERDAVVAFARRHPELRHRALTWTMIDEEVAYLAPSTVYRVLRDAGLIAAWPRPIVRRGHRPPAPAGVNELWQVDLCYVRVAGHTYFLLAFLDVWSRYVVHHELLRMMDGRSVALAAQAALERLPAVARARVRMQSDNGSAFVSGEFARTLARHGVSHHRIHPHTPEQNAFIERFMRTIGEALLEDELDSFLHADAVITELIGWYNTQRLHSGIGYVTPATMHDGRADAIHHARREKLAVARLHRRQANLGRRQLSLTLTRNSTPTETNNSPLSHFG